MSRSTSDSERAQRLLQQGEVDGAWGVVDAALEADPESVALLYLGAVCRRYQRRHDEALTLLQRLLAREPGHARAHQERGHLCLALGRHADAGAAYTQAVTLNPALPASWRALADLHQQAGARDAVRWAQAHATRLAELPRELVSVTSFLYEGRLYKAERLCRAYLRAHPQDVEAMRLLAELGVRLQVLDDAEFLLESALAFQPDHLPARVDYVGVLQKRQKFAAALAEAERACAMDPDNPALRLLLGNAFAAAGRYDRAIEIFDGERARQGGNPHLHMARGHALKTVGRRDDAVAAYRRAAVVRPGFGDAYWSLANLKTYRFTEAELARMAEDEAAPGTSLEDRWGLCFALGRGHELRGDYQQSFACYDRGNRLKRATTRYRPERMSDELAAQRAVCTAEFFERRAGWGCDAADPIFIVGLPRAGSTLIEQILASHSQVDGTLELPNVLARVHRLQGRRRSGEAPRYPAVLSKLGAGDLAGFGSSYLEETRFHRRGAPRFTDKMPNNFRHIGLIHLMLPNAKIIDARRDPMDCCVSGFKQLFAEGQEFSYGLDLIGSYYREYTILMAHWDAVLPRRVLRVQHETLLDDFETEVRRLLDFCELPFEPACLEFHRTERAVRTASSEQVRQPLNRDSVGQWRRFEPWLGPLKESLGSLWSDDRAA